MLVSAIFYLNFDPIDPLSKSFITAFSVSHRFIETIFHCRVDGRKKLQTYSSKVSLNEYVICFIVE